MGGSLDDAFADRLNGLTTLRMTLACLVLLSHSYVLGGRAQDPLAVRSVDAVNIADVALASFFIISGFFVTRSAMSSSTRRYLLRRALRILPGYWVCIVLCAFAIAPLAWMLDTGTLAGFLDQPESPFRFVTNNALLGLEQAGVAGVFSTTPYGEMHNRSILNGSLWTLPIEFGFYLIIGLLATTTLLRRVPIVVPLVGIAALAWFLALGRTTTAEDHGWYHFRIVGGWYSPLYTSKFLFAFMIGATLAVYAPRIALRHWAGAAAAMIVGFTLFVPTLAVVGGFWVTGEIALAYALLWIASCTPLWYRRLGWTNDYSYGIYIYAFPVQQLLAQVRLHTVSYWLYVFATFALVVPLAVLSWHFVERPMMRLKDWHRTGRSPTSVNGRRWSFPRSRRVDP